MGRVVDSSVLIELERRSAPLKTLFANYEDDELFAIAAITASELLAGVLRASGSRRVGRSNFVESVLAAIPVVPFDLQVARVHAQIGMALERSGAAIGAYDLLIAATAIHVGFTLCTFNLREFSQVPGLNVERPQFLP
jgi:predicted nucleic acid-binding protein